jgi:hypothetical protein
MITEKHTEQPRNSHGEHLASLSPSRKVVATCKVSLRLSLPIYYLLGIVGTLHVVACMQPILAPPENNTISLLLGDKLLGVPGQDTKTNTSFQFCCKGVVLLFQ